MKKKEISMPVRIAIALISLSATVAIWSVLGVFGGEVQQPETTQAQEQKQAQTSNVETIIDNDLVSVDYEGMYEAPGVEGVFYVSLNVQNKTDKTIWVYLDKASVNNETVSMVMTGTPLYIAPGNSGRTGFIFPMGQLSVHSLSGVEKVKFDLVVADKATLTEIWRGKDIEISQGS